MNHDAPIILFTDPATVEGQCDCDCACDLSLEWEHLSADFDALAEKLGQEFKNLKGKNDGQ